jgi:AraC family ethanolamine operon transcriptional activator
MGQPVGFNDLIVQRCGIEAEYSSAPLWDSVVFAIPEPELVQEIADITCDDPWDFIIHGVAHLTPQIAAQVRQASRAYLDAAPSSLATPCIPSSLPEMAHFLVRLWARALVSARPPSHAKASFNRQRQLIRKSEDYVAHLTEQPLRIGGLCREIGVSKRTLHDAFCKAANTSPLAYLKTQQLNRVYRVLHDADADEVMIKQIAFTCGFRHLGQLSRDYKQLFGELPSETLRRH